MAASLGFYGENNGRVRTRKMSCGLGIRVEHSNAVLILELSPPFGSRMAPNNLIGPNDLFAEKPGDHRLGHYAASDKGKAGSVHFCFCHWIQGKGTSLPNSKLGRKPCLICPCQAFRLFNSTAYDSGYALKFERFSHI